MISMKELWLMLPSLNTWFIDKRIASGTLLRLTPAGEHEFSRNHITNKLEPLLAGIFPTHTVMLLTVYVTMHSTVGHCKKFG